MSKPKRKTSSRFVKYRKFVIICSSVSVILILLLLFNFNRIFSDNNIYIGVVGPMSGQYKDVGIPIRDSVLMYYDKVNRLGGINGKQVKVIIKDDQNDAEQAKERALELAKDGRVSAVIGHRYSGPTLAAKDIL